MPIVFQSLINYFKPTQEKKLKKWITTFTNRKNIATGDINIIFCSDKYLLKMNCEYLKHNSLTDIITFDYSEDYQNIESDIITIYGDLFISIDRVKENATKYNVTFEHELYRVIIHGILHLAGYEDLTKDQELRMRKQELFAIKMFNNLQ